MEDVIQGPGYSHGVKGSVVLPQHLPLPVHVPPDPVFVHCTVHTHTSYANTVYNILPPPRRLHVLLLCIAVVAVQVAAYRYSEQKVLTPCQICSIHFTLKPDDC